MNNRYTFRLGSEVFGVGAPLCTGAQVAEVIRVVADCAPPLAWYAGDVKVVGRFPVRADGPDPVRVGDSEALVLAVAAVEQFDSGVFAGVRDGVSPPRFRVGGLSTEDAEDAERGDALVELRAFDVSYISVATDDDIVAQAIDAFAASRGGPVVTNLGRSPLA